MGRRKGGIDWDDLEREFLNSQLTLKEMAERRQVSYSAVLRRAKERHWTEKKAELTRERSSARLGQVTEKLLMKMAETIDGEKALEAKELKALGAALKELGEVKDKLEEDSERKRETLMVRLSGQLEEMSR